MSQHVNCCWENNAVIVQTVTNFVVAAEAERAERAEHEPYLVGVSVFVFLTLLLLGTLSFNRNK
ncbi:hypothetical protein [Sporichthya sp.]|uniref:hypothetical protein n=1 Tax=Sporichthya sp. TaxID=65475 RepID=UPI0018210471|nr:hypothetical protein [Sporichthya sp.]MBA3742904.1 hypothetical protein [Sporichthya sp.]